MKKRDLALCVVFSIITFGIYGIYWFIKINNDANELANPPKRTSGGVASCSRSLHAAFTASTGPTKWENSWILRLSSAVCRHRTAPCFT